MTTETQPETPEVTALKTTSCDNCGATVAIRRPSASGLHFCAEPECRKARARTNYHGNHSARARQHAELEQRRVEAHKVLLAALITAVSGEDRPDCDICGRKRTVPGYAHPLPSWEGNCSAAGSAPVPDNMGQAFWLAIFPQTVTR